MSSPRLLALETSSATASIALALGDSIAERTIETQRAQAGSVLECIDALLAEAGLALAALDAIVFGQGPGSFTGIRIAAAVAQGLGLASGRPIVTVSSLAALAQRGLAAVPDRGVSRALCCVDARMGEVYWGNYRLVDGLATALGPERLDRPAEVRAPDGAYLALGDGLAAHAGDLATAAAGAAALDITLVARARDLLPLAAGPVAAGAFVPLAEALPVYLRGADAWRRS